MSQDDSRSLRRLPADIPDTVRAQQLPRVSVARVLERRPKPGQPPIKEQPIVAFDFYLEDAK